MEGTRHEKAALIIAAYIIGFITAYIAFGLTKAYVEPQIMVVEKSQASERAATQQQYRTMSVGLGEDGLYAITKDRERMLSANKNVLSANAISSTGSQGFYYNIIDAEASRDGRYAYFCEQLTQTSDTCDPYVYVLETDSLHVVTVDNGTFRPLVTEHTSSWSDGSVLTLNGATSTDASQPWKLSTGSGDFQQ